MVDLAGFTALTEAHGDLRAADLATRFARPATDRLGDGDRLVKRIGDAVLLASHTTEAALALVTAYWRIATGSPTSPSSAPC